MKACHGCVKSDHVLFAKPKESLKQSVVILNSNCFSLILLFLRKPRCKNIIQPWFCYCKRSANSKFGGKFCRSCVLQPMARPLQLTVKSCKVINRVEVAAGRAIDYYEITSSIPVALSCHKYSSANYGGHSNCF